MSGERNTVFSHQYLFEGEDRQNSAEETGEAV